MIVKRVLIQNKYGLHARPAAVLARKAQSYEAAVTLRCSQKSADAKSILDVLSLSLGPGAQVDVAAFGHDADAAVREICNFFETGMGENQPGRTTKKGTYARHRKQQGVVRCR